VLRRNGDPDLLRGREDRVLVGDPSKPVEVGERHEHAIERSPDREQRQERRFADGDERIHLAAAHAILNVSRELVRRVEGMMDTGLASRVP
jgi:hypothetical protein